MQQRLFPDSSLYRLYTPAIVGVQRTCKGGWTPVLQQQSYVTVQAQDYDRFHLFGSSKSFPAVMNKNLKHAV